MPLIRRDRRGVSILEMPDFGIVDYNMPAIRRDIASSPRRLGEIGAKLKALLPPHDVFRVNKVREEHLPTIRCLLDGTWRKHDFAAHETSPFDAHSRWRSEALRPGFCKRLNRKKRAFDRAGEGNVRRLACPSEIEAALDFIASVRKGRFEGDVIQRAEMMNVYRKAAAVDPDFVGVYSLELDGRQVGAGIGTIHQDRFSYLLIGCDYKKFGKYSPGYMLYDETYRDFLEHGGRVFDLTVGDEDFKAKFGARPMSMYYLFRGRTLIGKTAALLHPARARLRGTRAGFRKWWPQHGLKAHPVPSLP